MKSKFRNGILLVILGAALLGFSYNAMQRISRAKSGVGVFKQAFGGSSYGSSAGGYLDQQASQYDTLVQLCFYTGIILIVGGGYYAFRNRR